MKRNTRGHTRILATIGLGAAVAALFAMPASADMTRWHPYFYLNAGKVLGVGQPWGDHYLVQIDDDTVDNVVWNEDTVYNGASAGESWYDVRGTTTALQDGHKLAIHNPTVNDYSGSDKILITLYDNHTGDQMTDADSEINTSPSNPDVSFNTSTDVFEVTVLSMHTVVITDSDFLDSGNASVFVMKIHSPKDGGGDGAFTAQSHNFNSTRWRINSGNADSNFKPTYLTNRAFRSYSLQAAEDLEGLTSPMLLLPYWIDSDDNVEKYTSYVHIANVDTVDLDITVEVFDLDGTSIKSYTFEDVPAQSLVTMIPSQFLDDGDDEFGYLEAAAVQSASPSTVGEILGVNHELQLSLVHFIPGAGWARSLKGDTLTIIDDE